MLRYKPKLPENTKIYLIFYINVIILGKNE